MNSISAMGRALAMIRALNEALDELGKEPAVLLLVGWALITGSLYIAIALPLGLVFWLSPVVGAGICAWLLVGAILFPAIRRAISKTPFFMWTVPLAAMCAIGGPLGFWALHELRKP